MPKQTKTSDKVREIQLRLMRQRQATLKRGNDYVPSKKSVKYSGRASITTADRNLRGVPGSSRNPYTSMVQEIAAKHTGTKTRETSIGILRSARNANTTSGNYVTTVVTEAHEVAGQRIISDPQGRKVFGR